MHLFLMKRTPSFLNQPLQATQWVSSSSWPEISLSASIHSARWPNQEVSLKLIPHVKGSVHWKFKLPAQSPTTRTKLTPLHLKKKASKQQQNCLSEKEVDHPQRTHSKANKQIHNRSARTIPKEQSCNFSTGKRLTSSNTRRTPNPRHRRSRSQQRRLLLVSDTAPKHF